MSHSNESFSMQAYLKKYMSADDPKQKKKKKITKSTIKRSKIIDDDIDLKSMRPLDDDEVELYQMDEDAPQIAGIVDERPPEIKAEEYYSSKRWKVFGGDNGLNVIDNMDKNQGSVSDKLSLMSKEFDKPEHSRNKGDLGTMVEIDEHTNSNQTKSTKEKSPKVKRPDSSESNSSHNRNTKSGRKSSSIQSSGTQKKHIHSDSDVSPQRQKKPQLSHGGSDLLPSRNNQKNSDHNDSDLSPPRNPRKSSYRDDSDSSIPRNKKNKSVRPKFDSYPPSRKDQTKKYDRYNSDSDRPLPRRDSKVETPNHSIKALKEDYKRGRSRPDPDNSSPRRNKGKKSNYKSSSDNSPPRKEKRRTLKAKSISDSDASLPRIREKGKILISKYDSKHIPHSRARRQTSSDSEISLSGRHRKKLPNQKRNSFESDKRKRSPRSNSPPIKPALLNKSTKSNVSPRLSRRDLMNERNVKRQFSDSDDSPPRRRKTTFRNDGSDSDISPPRKRTPLKKDLYIPKDNSSSDERDRLKNKKMKTTLDGKQAGLQDAKQLKKELSELRMKEDVMFSKLDASVSGIGAAPIKRDRKTGQVRDLEKEKELQKEKEAKEAVVNEKYYKWGKGLKQVEDAAVRAAEAMKEMNKPLARYINDTDLDKFLKAQEREGDPMLDYIKKKQSEATPLAGVKPIYKGPYNPNRFGIRPGHRWDGVVRSSGYEKEWFTHQNARKARDEEAYKWSTSDM